MLLSCIAICSSRAFLHISVSGAFGFHVIPRDLLLSIWLRSLYKPRHRFLLTFNFMLSEFCFSFPKIVVQ